MTLVPGDPLAHRALDSLLRAEASVRRRLSADLEREGLSATGFSVLVILTTAGGELELRLLRARLRTSKANATEVVTTLESRSLVHRARLADRPPRGERRDHPARRGDRGPAVPRAQRACGAGVRRSRRGREALARLDLPQARRLTGRARAWRRQPRPQLRQEPPGPATYTASPWRSAPSKRRSRSRSSRSRCSRAGASATSSASRCAVVRVQRRGSSGKARRPRTARPACTTS